MIEPVFYPQPTWSRLYDPLPHHFEGCRSVALLCRAPEGTLAQVVPYPLVPEAGQEEYFQLSLTRIEQVRTPGSVHRDLLMAELDVPVSHQGLRAAHCAIEYFSADFGVSVGREVWGFPKKQGHLDWTENDDCIHVEVRREGRTLMMADFTKGLASGTAEPDIFGIPNGEPFSYLQVRSPLGPMAPDAPVRLDVVRTEVESYVSHSSTPGSATLRLFDGPGDPLSFLRPEMVNARLDVYDFVFPWGEVVASVDLPHPEGAARSLASGVTPGAK
jgi:acetoacetate decarboxylase